MAFTGEVDIDIYFGTNYDIINVPFYTSQIVDDATKTLSLKGQVVWETTWLTEIVINVDDYQELVGAQYVRILETLPNQAGYHWYEVLSHGQLSNKSAALILRYDALLTMGIGNINAISGVLLRWSVDDDTPYKWHKSVEPLDQIDDFNYTYFRHRCISDNTGSATGTELYGFPYLMSKKPTVDKYFNPNGVSTDIFYPSMESTSLNTVFKSTIGGDYYYKDGFIYYDREHFNSVVRKNLDAAVGLGYDVVSNTWGIPATPMITVNQMSGTENDAVQSVIGSTVDVPTTIPLYPTGYNNQKAADMGNSISLYNEVTGDCVTVDAADLSTTTIRIMVNPYASGCFAARFIGYLHDPDGYSGIVKSAGWLPVNYTAYSGAGKELARINNYMQIESVWNGYNAQVRAIEATKQNSEATLNQLNRSTNRRTDIGVANWAAGLASAIGAIGIGAATGGVGMALGGSGGLLNSGTNLYGMGQTMDMSRDAAETAHFNITNSANVALYNLEVARLMQQRQLEVRGNIGQVAPPPTKFAGADMINGNAYDFVVRWTGLSGDDRRRLDYFLTAYGYNVKGTLLTKPEQLNTRTRFTFIQATDVEISNLKIAQDMTRNRDPATVSQIKERFEAGIRIWYDTPDFNYALKNPIRGD